jgi:hypothetical protein
MAKYEYIGSGQGVVGLPSKLTDEEAKALGVEKLLEEAVKAGRFKKIGQTKSGGKK